MPDPFDFVNKQPDFSESEPLRTRSTQRSANKKRRKFVRRDKAENTVDRQPPYNMEAEVGVLGSIMLMPEVCDDIVNLIRAEDFYDNAHQILFKHLMDMYNGGKKIDPLLLRETLTANDQLEEVGGVGRLAEIFQAVPNAAHARYYAEIVRGKSTTRNIIETCSDLLSDAYTPEADPDDLLNVAEQKVFSIRESRQSSNLAAIDEVLTEAMDRLDARVRGETMEGTVETGFTDLDRMTGGLHASELVILAARPSMGKNGFCDEHLREYRHQIAKANAVYQPRDGRD